MNLVVLVVVAAGVSLDEGWGVVPLVDGVLLLLGVLAVYRQEGEMS